MMILSKNITSSQTQWKGRSPRTFQHPLMLPCHWCNVTKATDETRLSNRAAAELELILAEDPMWIGMETLSLA